MSAPGCHNIPCVELIFVMQDRNGWDMMRALNMIKSEYKHDPVTIKAVVAIEKRVRLVRARAPATHATFGVSFHTCCTGRHASFELPPGWERLLPYTSKGRRHDVCAISWPASAQLCLRISWGDVLACTVVRLQTRYQRLLNHPCENCQRAAEHAEVPPDAGSRCKISFAKPQRRSCQISTTYNSSGPRTIPLGLMSSSLMQPRRCEDGLNA